MWSEDNVDWYGSFGADMDGSSSSAGARANFYGPTLASYAFRSPQTSYGSQDAAIDILGRNFDFSLTTSSSTFNARGPATTSSTPQNVAPSPSSFLPQHRLIDDGTVTLSSSTQFASYITTASDSNLPTIQVNGTLAPSPPPPLQTQTIRGSEVHFPTLLPNPIHDGLLTPATTLASRASRSPSPLELPPSTRRRRARSSPGPSSVGCSMCHERFTNRKGLTSHRNYEHGSEQARELINGHLQYYDEDASVLRAMACSMNMHGERPQLRDTLKDAVRALNENQVLSVAQIGRFQAAFLEFAEWWVAKLKCDSCGREFSRRDSMTRHIRNSSCDSQNQL